MSKHTPGPWRVAKSGCQIQSNDAPIAKAWMMRNGEGKANAHLIAAAPDLLDALKEMIEAYQYEASADNPSLKIARAAIAKATGE